MALRILHLAGSPTSEAFYELSLVYARGCLDALGKRDEYVFVNVVVAPDGTWRFTDGLDRAAIHAAEPLPPASALARIAAGRIDVALPQMFCVAGMTHYRAILDVLGIPYLGNAPEQMALAADKAKTRAIVASNGVDVPSGELVRRGGYATLAPPAVVKPATSDNSDGVSYVTSVREYGPALDEAFRHSETVLVERFVELGREVRCGIVARNGEPVALPLEEYYVDPVERPIRTRDHKLKRNADNGIALVAKERTQAWIVAGDDPAVAVVQAAALRCHVALGCRHYSLFDFRLDPRGRPWFLEAGLYCSFSPQSVIVTMARAAGIALDDLFDGAIDALLHSSHPGRA